MIKKIILPLVAILILSSCANKFSLQKRKYTKGYYFSNSKNNSSKTNNAEIVKTIKVKNLETKTIALTNSVEEKQIIEQPIVFAKNNYVNTNFKNENKKITLTASATKIMVNTTVAKEFKEVKFNNIKNSLIKAKDGESGAKLVIMVILCLFPFINLIPVYIHDGNKATLNFWITLLLNFTLLGGVIFALLVIFDIVNLE